MRAFLRRFAGGQMLLGLLGVFSLLLLAVVIVSLARPRHNSEGQTWPPKWSFSALSQIISTPAIENAVVFATSADATVYALSLATGEVIWQTPLAMPSTAAPIVKYGLVFVGSNEPAFSAFEVLTGALVWGIRASDPISQPCAFAKGKVFFADDSGLVTGADAVTGKVLWRFQGKNGEVSAPCLTTEGICVSSRPSAGYGQAGPGLLCLLEEATGKLRWSLRIDVPSLHSPAAEGGIVYIGGGKGQFLAIRAADGGVVWSADIGGEVEKPPWVQGDKVFIVAGNQVVCLLAESGRILWRQSLKGQITTPPGGDERQIFVATERGIIYLLDADKGRLLWKWKVGDIVSGRIISASGSLFFGTWRGKLLALPLPAEIQR